MPVTHEKLQLIQVNLPDDYKPYGKQKREGSDCSCGCVHFAPLEGKVSADWGVCTNDDSHRAGLLTFEHQGCSAFESDKKE